MLFKTSFLTVFLRGKNTACDESCFTLLLPIFFDKINCKVFVIINFFIEVYETISKLKNVSARSNTSAEKSNKASLVQHSMFSVLVNILVMNRENA